MEAPEIKAEAPEFFQPGFCSPQFAPERRHSLDGKAGGGCGGDPFMVDDLLDFSTTDDAVGGGGCGGGGGDGAFDNVTGSSTDSNVTAMDSCNSSFSGYDPNFGDGIGGCHRGFAEGHFASDLCVPYDDLAELEWLSNFAEESFSSEDLQKLQLISGMKARPDAAAAAYETTAREFQPEPNRGGPIFHPDMSVPAKARSKRSRAAPGSWSSRLLVLSQSDPAPDDDGAGGPGGAPRPVAGKKTIRAAPKKKQPGLDGPDGPDGPDVGGGEVRRCLHCQTDKTPQWRTGPMGPKTLCNACGVRYKSGRLVPEYRPAASPTFVLTRHSNSHRKVLELRRQKEMMRAQQLHQQQQQFLHQGHHQSMVFDASNGEDYLIHQHVGPDFRQLM